jgi:hypothetical protein
MLSHALTTVVNKMNHRKSIKMLDPSLGGLGENHYPKIDYEQIYKGILEKGLDPIGAIRERVYSSKESETRVVRRF